MRPRPVLDFTRGRRDLAFFGESQARPGRGNGRCHLRESAPVLTLVKRRKSELPMVGSKQRALYQPFLPEAGQRAYVWKHSPSAGGRRPRHFHLEPELNLVLKGSAVFGIGDRVARVTEGELLAFPAGQDH